ncbi:MAG: MFS transporter [Patescibacteria group bacterium]
MNQTVVKKNILNYYLAHVFSGVSFILPITVLYYSSFGLSFLAIGSLESIFLLVGLVFEIPTGVIADLIGRRRMSGLGMLLIAFGMLVVGLGSTYLAFVVGQLLFGIGAAMRSGADAALMYDSLDAHNQADRYGRVEGRSFALFSIFGAIAAPIGAWLFVINRRLPFFLDAIFITIAALFYGLMVEVRRLKLEQRPKPFKQIFLEGIKDIITKPIVGWYIATTVFLSLIAAVFVSLINQPLLVASGLSVQEIGYLFVPVLILQAIVSVFAEKVEKRLKERLCLFIIILLPGISLLLMGTKVALLIFLGLLLFSGNKGFHYPIMKQFLQHRLNTGTRATTLSIQNFIDSLAGIIFLPVFGFLLDSASIVTSTRWIGVGALIVGLFLLLSRKWSQITGIFRRI